jgi:hypothetical protein
MRDEEQAENLERVGAKINPIVVEFCRAHIGRQFFEEDLRRYVLNRDPFTAPGSPGRILRDARQAKQIDYELISRRESLYLVTWVAGQNEADMDDLSKGQRAAAIVLATPFLQQINKRGADVEASLERICRETGLSRNILERTATVYRRSPDMYFPRIVRGEMGAESAYRAMISGQGNGHGHGNGRGDASQRPPNQKQRLKDRTAHSLVGEVALHLVNYIGALMRDVDLVGAWRHGPLDEELKDIHQSRRLLTSWEKEMVRAKKEATS